MCQVGREEGDVRRRAELGLERGGSGDDDGLALGWAGWVTLSEEMNVVVAGRIVINFSQNMTIWRDTCSEI